jgi:2-(1,2-epoxy-1,2-dihydrophenyl)acetyl-CoA isomerase
MKFEHMTYEVDRKAHIAMVILNNPEKLNALDDQMKSDILVLCDEMQNDDDVWAIIWAGAGRGFCSGAYVANGPALPPDEDRPLNQRLEAETWISKQGKAIYGIDKPMIAAINGVAAGAGFSLALSCDMRVGSENASFVTVFSERNLPPEGGMSYLLPRVVGMGRAMDLILTSRRVDAQEAYRLGLLDRLVSPDNLIATARAIAERICELPPGAVRITKRSVRRALDSDFAASTEYESQASRFTGQTPKDGAESRIAFQEKRKPVYTGR